MTSLHLENLIKAFSNWLKIYPKPVTCLTDNGRNYISRKFNDFLAKHNIRHKLSRAYNPTGNGISERLNQTIKRVLQTNQGCRISELLRKINFTIQNQPHSKLGRSPFEFVNCYSRFDPEKRNLENVSENRAEKWGKQYKGMREELIRNEQIMNIKQKK